MHYTPLESKQPKRTAKNNTNQQFRCPRNKRRTPATHPDPTHRDINRFSSREIVPKLGEVTLCIEPFGVAVKHCLVAAVGEALHQLANQATWSTTHNELDHLANCTQLAQTSAILV